jgi:hypothetical protein
MRNLKRGDLLCPFIVQGQELHVVYMRASYGDPALSCYGYSNELWYFGTKSEALQCHYSSLRHVIIMSSNDFTITVLGQPLSICLVALSPVQ